MLRRWDDSRYDPDLKFSTPTIWKKPMAEENCYFCQNDVKRLNRKNKRAFIYTDVSTVTKPVERLQAELDDEVASIRSSLKSFIIYDDVDRDSMNDYATEDGDTGEDDDDEKKGEKSDDTTTDDNEKFMHSQTT